MKPKRYYLLLLPLLLFAALPARAQEPPPPITVSVSSTGEKGNGWSSSPAISSHGRFIVFTSFADNLVPGDTNGLTDVFVHDRQTGQTRRVSVSSGGVQSDGPSNAADISANGRWVVFTSYARNLVPQDTNNTFDVFTHDLLTGETRRVSVSARGVEANGPSYEPSIAGDGRYLAFVSKATNLIAGDENGYADVFIKDQNTG
ncbi:MAG: hypothetical protein GY803_28635, partial [Chloroflexi bacterium]|nr:hypothetical protein [Chloroflexota bacterium]